MWRKKLLALARAIREHPGELRADFQQFYGLDMDKCGVEFSTIHAADLLMQLPEGARIRTAYDTDAVWTTDRMLMAEQLNTLRLLLWAQTKDGQRNRNRPEPIGPERKRGTRKVAQVMTIEELEKALSRPRTGV